MRDFTKQADRLDTITASCATVTEWLNGIQDESWANQAEGSWTVKDLVGHLAAWSDLLLDQIEALAQNTPDKIKRIDINDWNEAQITARRDWTVAKVRQEWEQSTTRARSIIERLPDDMWTRRTPVPWAKEPVSLQDLLDLWNLHITQHQDAWEV
jgi:hypothetical protein